jgi:hypothetical protein
VDQLDNIQVLVQQGMAVPLPKERLVAGPAVVALEAISRALADGSYARTAGQASRRLRAAGRHPSEQAADWFEYAARIAGEGQLLLPFEARLSWWQLALLDVLALLGAGLLALALCWAARALLRCAFGRGRGGSRAGGKVKSA